MVRFLALSLLVMLAGCASGGAHRNIPDGKILIVGKDGAVVMRDCPVAPDPATLKIDPLPVIPAAQGGTVTRGKPIKIVPPLFPICASEREVSGIADFAFTVQPDGSVGDIKLLQEVPAGFGFAQAAEAVLPQWQFQPKLISGKPAAFPVTYRFTMRNVGSHTAAQQTAEKSSQNPSASIGQ
jgi:hypothetical protein